MNSNPILITREESWGRFREEIAARPESRAVLSAKADSWLNAEPFSVVDKKQVAPSGDPHDYVSMGPYWWPDPAKPDGLPWINRDGEVNPATENYDKPKLERLSTAVIQLILQAHATGSATYARKAGQFLRAWFQDEATRMNPHLRYGQFIPGICDGRCFGIIDTTALVFLLDAVTHLDFNDEWTPRDLAGLKDWISGYLDWLLTSDIGKEERATLNNHGTWYDAQVACFAIFCGKPAILGQIEEWAKKRISTQLQPDGSQPHELKRTLSFTYSTYNLMAFAHLARFIGHAGVDLWHWKSPTGASLSAAVQWMLPYYSGAKKWEYQQLKSPDLSSVVFLLNIAGEGSMGIGCTEVARGIERHPWEKMSFCKTDLVPKK